MVKIKKNNIIYILFLFVLLNIQCNRAPMGAFKTIEGFFQFRIQENYAQVYSLFCPAFQRDIPIDRYIAIEKINKQQAGDLKEYKLLKWTERKNFSCGMKSGRMVVLTYDCIYENRRVEEIFTMIHSDDTWQIFDYIIQPAK